MSVIEQSFSLPTVFSDRAATMSRLAIVLCAVIIAVEGNPLPRLGVQKTSIPQTYAAINKNKIKIQNILTFADKLRAKLEKDDAASNNKIHTKMSDTWNEARDKAVLIYGDRLKKADDCFDFKYLETDGVTAALSSLKTCIDVNLKPGHQHIEGFEKIAEQAFTDLDVIERSVLLCVRKVMGVGSVNEAIISCDEEGAMKVNKVLAKYTPEIISITLKLPLSIGIVKSPLADCTTTERMAVFHNELLAATEKVNNCVQQRLNGEGASSPAPRFGSKKYYPSSQ